MILRVRMQVQIVQSYAQNGGNYDPARKNAR